MKQDILKRIKNNIKEEMKTLSFKSSGQWYIRVVNKEVYQSMWFQSFSGGKSFTINIGIFPICGEYRTEKIGNIRIGPWIYKKDKWFDYTSESIDEVTRIIKNEIIPLFNQTTTYNDLYDYIKNQIICIPRQERDFNDITTYIWDFIGNKDLAILCCKLKKYDEASICIKNGIDFINYINESNIKNYDDMIKNANSEEYKKRFNNDKKEYIAVMNKKISELEKLQELINKEDSNKLTTIINNNEKQNQKFLKEYII